jgi:hypothetical protein
MPEERGEVVSKYSSEFAALPGSGKHPSGAEDGTHFRGVIGATERLAEELDSVRNARPQGLKPTFVLGYLRRD